jgi:hypothetical protein
MITGGKAVGRYGGRPTTSERPSDSPRCAIEEGRVCVHNGQSLIFRVELPPYRRTAFPLFHHA